MTIAEDPRNKRLTWTVVGLLGLVVFINYVDRGNLATAAPLIKDELKLSGSQFGLLVSAFFWTYAPANFIAGWLAERFNPYRVLAVGVTIWALATAATGLANSFVMLLMLRIALGVGESVAFPCSSMMFARSMPVRQLGLANGVITLGLSLGPAFGTWAGGHLMGLWSWRPVFIVFGLTSLLWLVPWWLFTRGSSALEAASARGEYLSFREVTGRRELWGASLGHFCGNYIVYFVISWLPLYLVKSRGFTMGQMANLGGLIYLTYAASGIGLSVVLDRWIASGASTDLVRRGAMVATFAVMSATMAICAFADARLSIACLFIAAVAFGVYGSTMYSASQTMAGREAGGKWMGIQNGVGNLAGIVAPLVTGFVVDVTGQFSLAFAVAAAMGLGGMAFWGLVVQRVAPIDWRAVAATS